MSTIQKICFVVGISFFIFPNTLFGMDLKELDPVKNCTHAHSLQRVKEIYDSSYDPFFEMHALPEFIDFREKQFKNKNEMNLVFHEYCTNSLNCLINERSTGEKNQNLIESFLKYTKHTLEDEVEYYGHLSYLYKYAYINSQKNRSFTDFIENKFDIFSGIDMDKNIRKKVESMIKKEEEYPEYIPFYHGYNEEVGVLYAINSEILNATYKYENPINWASRLLMPTQNINDLN